MSSSVTRVFTIASATYKESMRSKILYSVLVFAILIVSISALFGSVTIGDQSKVIKDFGLFALSLFSILYCVISGSTLLHKELARKTIYNVLSKPVRRWEFLVGKFFGMFAMTFSLLAIMGIAFSGFVFLFDRSFSPELFQGYFHILLELLIVCGAVILFSSIVVTPLLIGLFSFGLFLAGRSLDLLLYFIEEEMVTGFGVYIIKGFYWVLPQLNTININDALVYQLELSPLISLWSLLYSVAYTTMLLLLAAKIFERRQFQ